MYKIHEVLIVVQTTIFKYSNKHTLAEVCQVKTAKLKTNND